jgi:hypothetical protein
MANPPAPRSRLTRSLMATAWLATGVLIGSAWQGYQFSLTPAGSTVPAVPEQPQPSATPTPDPPKRAVHRALESLADMRTNPPAPASGPGWLNCDDVRAAGAAPIHSWEPGFEARFDRDNDGVGCE